MTTYIQIFTPFFLILSTLPLLTAWFSLLLYCDPSLLCVSSKSLFFRLSHLLSVIPQISSTFSLFILFHLAFPTDFRIISISISWNEFCFVLPVSNLASAPRSYCALVYPWFHVFPQTFVMTYEVIHATGYFVCFHDLNILFFLWSPEACYW